MPSEYVKGGSLKSFETRAKESPSLKSPSRYKSEQLPLLNEDDEKTKIKKKHKRRKKEKKQANQ